MKIKVAAVQFAPVMGQKAENLRRLAHLVAGAAKAGAELVVLPELCATGYSFMGEEEARPHAESIEPASTTLGVFRALAKKFGIHLLGGLVEIDRGTGDLHNSQIYADPTGYFLSYRKVNPWGNDYLWAKPGIGNPPVVRAKFRETTRKVGLLICRDARNKKNDDWSFYGPGDADIVCLSANWGNGGFPSTTWMDFVEENKSALIVSNRYGKEGCNDFGEGGVCVIEPSGKVHCQGLVWSRDCFVIAEV
jgi:predicted amidohydrolase